MTDEQITEFISETRTFLRDFKIKELLETKSNEFEILKPKRGFFSFLYKGWRKIDELSQLGGIITGSTALSLYRFNGQPLINRKTNDWDILLSRENFLKFCGLNNLSNFYYDKDRITISLSSGIFVGNYGYHETTPHYILKHDLDLIAKSELPESIKVGQYRIATLESIIHEKLDIIEKNKRVYNSKHIEDCNLIITKLQAYAK